MSGEALLAELNPRGGAALVQAWHGDDPEAVVAYYTDDAVLVVDAESVYRGRAEILNGFLRQWVDKISLLTPAIEQVVGGPGQMMLIGRYTAEVSPPNGAPYQARGAFGNTWLERRTVRPFHARRRHSRASGPTRHRASTPGGGVVGWRGADALRGHVPGEDP